MSKAVRWQVPFVSVSGTKYRVDIYDETGSWSGVTQLLPGDQPFVTDEDASDDYFAPVRSQSGTLQVCTYIEPQTTYPSGGTLSLNDILPANNIAHPVRLVSIAANNAETIEWQGFLSCEAYNQDYVGIPQNLSLSLISVLEAMDSVQLDPLTTNSLKYAYRHIYDALHEIDVQSGINNFAYVRYPMTDWRIFEKYIDATIFFERKEYNNENSTTYIVSGLSCKNVIERLAKYMGWTVREYRREVFFERIGESIGMCQQSLYQFGNNFHYSATPENIIVTKSLASDVGWRGTGHQRSVEQGAKSVEVIAKLEKYDLDIYIPGCPVGSLITSYRQLWSYQTYYGDWLYVLANSNINAYSNISVAYYSMNANLYQFDYEDYLTSDINELLDHFSTGENSSAVNFLHLLHNWTRWYAGAFLCKFDWEDTGTATAHNTADGLYCVFFPHTIRNRTDGPSDEPYFDPTSVGPIFSINSITNFSCHDGYLKLTANADTVYFHVVYPEHGMDHSSNLNDEWYISLELKFGNSWWNGAEWQNSQCTFFAKMANSGFKDNWDSSMHIVQTSGLLIPISGSMQGDITLKIWPMASALSSDIVGVNSGMLEMIFTSLDVEYAVPDDATLTDRSENRYYRLLGTNFRDEISIDTELASMLNNQPSPSLIMDDSTTPMKELDYTISGGTEARRPEVDLLNRLAAYYGAARQRLELEVAHPTAAPLPLLKLNGINDGKVYLPLSESRDWQTGVCKLTCFETPT